MVKTVVSKTTFMGSNPIVRTNLYKYMKKKNDNKKVKGTFTGSIDELLEHTSTLDPDISNADLQAAQREAGIEYIMKVENVDREQAEEIYNEIALMEVSSVVEDLVKKGIMELQGYDENGEPKYGLTELGKKMAEQLKDE